ncbi:non-ribosomal peptide synthetase [Bacillus sp. LB7]|uniref:non-ribosomal peptide synthetase n=1 Tax=Bacillus sp. LB7 TaxID=3043238 RepID=UPI002648E77A|nr:non-ribosomal peptide synthetase [Bacillus sp. LB7]MDN5386235.1 non-ribosomal peptide synthetase [Bacillus sp. LB7]
MDNNLIGLMTDRNVHAINGIFGILKSGNGFVPLSPTDPIKRLAHIVKECQFEIMVTENKYISRIYKLTDCLRRLKCLIVLDHLEDIEKWRREFASVSLFDQRDIEARQTLYDKKNGPSTEGAAYVVYTSGTTGKPKGVEITHHNLMPLFYWQKEHFLLGRNIKCLQTLPLNFDFGIQEVFTTLCFGGTLYFTDVEHILNPEMYVDFLNEKEINMVYSTPSFFKEIVNHYKRIKYVNILLLGGEKLSVELMADAWNIIPEGCTVFNGYGPTEASINCLMFPVTPSYLDKYEGIQSVPVGVPTGHSQIFILDDNLKPLPSLVPGQIYISGPGVAKGYLKNIELSQTKFLNNPFKTGYSTMYKTGDLARYLPDGNIEFLGRVDNQVKVKGYRIELGEVENILSRHPLVSESVVLVNDQDEIEAYVKLQNPGNLLDQQTFFHDLNAHLPRYMIPTKFYKMDRLPKTNNGKLDTRTLSECKVSLFDEAVSTANPLRTSMEEMIANIWGEVIGTNRRIGAFDNFFDLGGHSLLLAKVQKRIEEQFGVLVPLVKFFEYPTISSLCDYLKAGYSASLQDHPLAIQTAASVKKRRNALGRSRKVLKERRINK